MSETPTEWPEEWQSPEEYAEFIDETNSGDGEGVRQDALIECAILAGDYAARFSDMYVSLDAIIDDPAVVPTDLNDHIWTMHGNTKQLSRYFDALETELRRRLTDEADAE